MAWLADFASETIAGVLGAFAGVFLALLAERRSRGLQAGRDEEALKAEFLRTRHTVLGSIVKNTSEAKRVRSRLQGGAPVMDAALELAIWDATRDQFIRLCPTVDERVLFTRFFDSVERLRDFIEFHRGLHSSVVTARMDRDDPELRTLMDGAAQRVQDMADDVRLTGVMLVNDFGEAVHKRMMGIRGAATAEPGRAPAA